LNCFSLWFSLRFLSFLFNYFLFINCRFDHREIIISHYFFFLTITMRWSWDDRLRKINYWKKKKKRRLNCVVTCVYLWIEKKMKVVKILRIVIKFQLKKRKLDVVFNDLKFNLFVLIIMLCFVNLFQSEMMLSSSKKIKENFEIAKFEFSNWFDDDVKINKASWLKINVANLDDDDFSNWQNIRVETIRNIVFLNWLKNCVKVDEKIKKKIAIN
jgi:hypothetical protein